MPARDSRFVSVRPRRLLTTSSPNYPSGHESSKKPAYAPSEGRSMKRTALFVLLLILLPCEAFAQTAAQASYPSRAVRLITPVTSGGTADFVARAVAKKLD